MQTLVADQRIYYVLIHKPISKFYVVQYSLVGLLHEVADDPVQPLLEERHPDPLEAVDGQVRAGIGLLQGGRGGSEREGSYH